RLTTQLLSGTRTPMGMPMDVWQTDDGFHVFLDLPGVDPDSVDITTERNVLTITAERRPEYQQGQNVVIAERPQGTFTRQLQLGDTVDSENIQASYGDGVLHLTLSMTQTAQPQRRRGREGRIGQQFWNCHGQRYPGRRYLGKGAVYVTATRIWSRQFADGRKDPRPGPGSCEAAAARTR